MAFFSKTLANLYFPFLIKALVLIKNVNAVWHGRQFAIEEKKHKMWRHMDLGLNQISLLAVFNIRRLSAVCFLMTHRWLFLWLSIQVWHSVLVSSTWEGWTLCTYKSSSGEIKVTHWSMPLTWEWANLIFHMIRCVPIVHVHTYL